MEPDLFNSAISDRYIASRTSAEPDRCRLAADIASRIGSPRLGTSGAANAYVIFIGSEFGTNDSIDRPHYSLRTMGEEGWSDLWRLRIGEPNPHFDARWSSLRETTCLWKRLHDWLPDAFDSEQVAHASFAWANLAITAGGSSLGTRGQYREGMRNHVVPLILAARARIVVATNEATAQQTRSWLSDLNAQPLQVGSLSAYRVTGLHGELLVAKLGHPSRGTSRHEFVGNLRSLLSIAEQDRSAAEE